MGTVTIVSDSIARFKDFVAYLEQAGHTWLHRLTGETIRITAALPGPPDLVVIDEHFATRSSVDVIRQLLRTNAFLNIAAVSASPAKDFHEDTEGLGIVMQLANPPTREDAVRVASYLAGRG